MRTVLVGLLLVSAAFGQGNGRRARTGGELLLPFDRSRDGVISSKELAAAWRHLDLDSSGSIERSEAAGPFAGGFDTLDRDHDGTLDRDELRRAARSMPRLPQPQARLPDPDGPLPPLAAPRANPPTPAKVVLGKMLFWEQQVSSSRTVACGSCHAPRHGGADERFGRHPGHDGLPGTDDDVFGSPGAPLTDGSAVQVSARASPAFFGTLHAPRLFWDGRAEGRFRDPLGRSVLVASGGALESQSLEPILSPVEMGHEGRTWDEVVDALAAAIPMARATRLPEDVLDALASAPTYPRLFANAFGDERITPSRLAFALASYERTLVPDQTPFDRYVAGEKTAMTPNQIRGWRAFRQSTCAVCHPPPFFTDHTFRNIGVRPADEDPGRAAVTRRRADRGRFKVPSLRNLGLRRRFMHNGRFTSLRQVLVHYAGFGARLGDDVDPLMRHVRRFGDDRNAVLDFLANALTDPRVAREAAPFDHPALR